MHTLGVGITYSSVIEPLLRAHPELVEVLEFEPQTTWVKSPEGTGQYRPDEKVLRHLLTLPGRKLIHSVGALSVGPYGLTPATSKVCETICYFDSPWVSDHLSFNQTPELATGFFLPPRQTQAGVDLVVDSIRHLQAALGVPVCVETGANYLRPRPDEPDGNLSLRSLKELTAACCWTCTISSPTA
jgi:hypothetical protein